MPVRRFITYWIPVLICMAMIFAGSTGALSHQKTSRFIGPFLRWFSPDASEETVRAIQYGIRKCGHLTEYAVLAALLWRARRQPGLHPEKPWLRSEAVFAISVSALYAVTDEWHQSFESTRQGSGWDVLIDTVGAGLGILAIWAVGHWRKRW